MISRTFGAPFGRLAGIAAIAMIVTAAPSLFAQTPASTSTPPQASRVVAEAVERAKAERKVVLVEFGASWCTWSANSRRS